jgi:hypothetical protein
LNQPANTVNKLKQIQGRVNPIWNIRFELPLGRKA